MGIKRMTWFFQDSSNHGWSETHYLDPSVTLAQAYNKMVQAAAFRVPLIGSGSTLIYGRVSDDMVKGDSLINVFHGGGFRYTTSAEGPSDIGFTSLLIRLQSVIDVPAVPGPPAVPAYTQVNRGMTFLRGIDDNLIRDGGIFTTTPQFTADFAAFQTGMINASFGLRIVNNIGLYPIITLTQQAQTGMVTLVVLGLATAGGMDNNGHQMPNLIKVANLPRSAGWGAARGVRSCFNTGSQNLPVAGQTTFQFISKRVLPTYLGGGTVSIPTPVFSPYTSMQALRGVDRKAGKSFAQPVGRRTVR